MDIKIRENLQVYNVRRAMEFFYGSDKLQVDDWMKIGIPREVF